MSLSPYLHHSGCRCPHDLRVQRVRKLGWERGQKQTVPALGTTRRLRALAVAGWTTGALAEASGITQTRIKVLQRGDIALIYATTHRQVVWLYEQLNPRSGPVPGGDIRAANRAARLGWAPAAAWDDIDNSRERPKR